jgi:hypothetical protein
VALVQDRITLIVFRPTGTAPDEIRRFWEHQPYKNRVVFVTGNTAAYDTTLQRAAELSAIRTIIGELRQQGLRENDPQLEEADQIKTKKESNFYQACRETFQTIYYPTRERLNAVELDPKFVANEYKGEEQVVAALREAFKYVEATGPDSSFRHQIENRLWPKGSREVLWADLKRRGASDPSWVWYHPRALDALKDELIKRDIWREHGTFVERGPFPKPPTAALVQQIGRDDNTGEVRLRVRPQHGDTVYWSAKGVATPASERLDGQDLTTAAMRLSFLAVDSTGEHETGEPEVWTNTITVKHRLYQDGDQWRCDLRAIPTGTLRYTTDGSGPEGHGLLYGEPFVVPAGCRLILAVAEADGVRSGVVHIDAPQFRPGTGGGAEKTFVLDPARPATWRREHKQIDTNGTYTLLDAAKKNHVALGHIALNVVRGPRWVEFRTAEDVLLPAEQVIEHANMLKEIVPDGNLDVTVDILRVERGSDLLDLVRDLKDALQDGEVVQ